MDTSMIVAVLMFGTLLAGLVFAIVSKKKTKDRLEADNTVKSTLAADKADDGKPADV